MRDSNVVDLAAYKQAREWDGFAVLAQIERELAEEQRQQEQQIARQRFRRYVAFWIAMLLLGLLI